MAHPDFGPDLGFGLFLAELLTQMERASLSLSLVEYSLDYWLDRIGANA